MKTNLSEINEFNLMNELYDFYGRLLTEKQRNVFEGYYFYNLSLSEIAINESISKSAVLDNLEHSKKKLLEYEDSLKFKKKINAINKMDIPNDIKAKIVEELLK